MRVNIFLLSLLFLFSCNRENEEIRVLEAYIDGQKVSFEGAMAQRYDVTKDDVLIGYNYRIANRFSPSINISAYDSISLPIYTYPDLKASYVYTDSATMSAVYYNIIEGSLEILEETEDLLKGEFNLILVGTHPIERYTDTLEIKDGFFEITLEEYLSILP